MKRILLIKLRAIGDAVLTLPSLEALYRGFGRPQISVICPPQAAEVYAEDPRCAEVIVYDRARLRSWSDHASFWQSLQGRNFELAVCLHASFRTALLGWASGAPRRSVRNHSGPDWFCNLKSSEPKEPKSIIQRDFDALRACGLDPQDECPRLSIPAQALKLAGARWKRWRVKGKAVLIFPGAGKPEKRWPAGNFSALGRAMKVKGRTPVFLAGPGEEDLSVLARSCQGVADRVQSLKELGALCRKAGVAIGNDSGPRHIAAASGARTLTLFGPEATREWHPYKKADGHWAISAPQGKIDALAPGRVIKEALTWLR